VKAGVECKHPSFAGVVTLLHAPPLNYPNYCKEKRSAPCRSIEGGIMDILSPIVFAMAVITLVGLVAASFLIWWELRTPVRRAPGEAYGEYSD
jgi:hypothetical protein